MVVCPCVFDHIRSAVEILFLSSQKIFLFPQCSSKGNLHTGFDKLRCTVVQVWVGISGLENEFRVLGQCKYLAENLSFFIPY